jgi:hypothetical protein
MGEDGILFELPDGSAVVRPSMFSNCFVVAPADRPGLKKWVWRVASPSIAAILVAFVVTFWAPVERTSWFLLVFVGVSLAWFLSHIAIARSFRKHFPTARMLGPVESRYAVAASFGIIRLTVAAVLLGFASGGAIYFAGMWGPTPQRWP